MKTYDLSKDTFISPEGKHFMFRYAIEGLFPIADLPRLHAFLDKTPRYYFIPMAANLPPYYGYLVEDLMPFFINLIGQDLDCLVKRKITNKTPVPHK